MLDNYRHFDKKGFAVFKKVLDANFLSQVFVSLNESIHEAFARSSPSNPTVQIGSLWETNPTIKRLIYHENLTTICKKLLGCDEIKLWHDQLIIKPADTYKETPWHQDFAFWPMAEPTALTCWIPLVDVDISNGCLKFIIGSHKWSNFPSVMPIALKEILLQCGRDYTSEKYIESSPMSQGDCSFHHPLTYHGAFENTTKFHRISFKIVYMNSATGYRNQPHFLTSSLNLVERDIISGPLFPIIH